MVECRMARRVGELLEAFVFTAILLALAQTFLEDYGVLAAWPGPTRG